MAWYVLVPNKARIEGKGKDLFLHSKKALPLSCSQYFHIIRDLVDQFGTVRDGGTIRDPAASLITDICATYSLWPRKLWVGVTASMALPVLKVDGQNDQRWYGDDQKKSKMKTK